MTMTQEALHFFTGVAFDLMPDVGYADLEELSQRAKYNGRSHHYAAAREALQKVQWAKISAMQAVSVEEEIIAQYKPGVLSLHPLGQVQHAKALFELVAHAKSALDSLSVCLMMSMDWGSKVEIAISSGPVFAQKYRLLTVFLAKYFHDLVLGLISLIIHPGVYAHFVITGFTLEHRQFLSFTRQQVLELCPCQLQYLGHLMILNM